MKRGVVIALVVGVGVAVWVALRPVDTPPARDAGPRVDAASAPLAEAADAAVRLDAVDLPPPPPSLPPTPAEVVAAEADGLMNREARWIGPMTPPGWGSTDTGWRSPLGTTVDFAVREGRVVGARARFPEAAFSSALSALTTSLIGHQGGGGAMLPGGEEAESMTVERGPRSGTVKFSSGEMDWTLWLRTTGEPPYGPARFDLGDVGPLDGSTGPGP